MNQRAFRVIGFIKPLVTNCPTTSSNAPSSPASHDDKVYQSLLDVHRLTDLWHEASHSHCFATMYQQPADPPVALKRLALPRSYEQ